MISAVAQKYNIHPQTLRLYEREGLLKPSRTDGNTRLYSEEDLEQLETILSLTRDLGVNLAGVEIILNMRRKIERMQHEVNEFMEYVKRELVARASTTGSSACRPRSSSRRRPISSAPRRPPLRRRTMRGRRARAALPRNRLPKNRHVSGPDAPACAIVAALVATSVLRPTMDLIAERSPAPIAIARPHSSSRADRDPRSLRAEASIESDVLGVSCSRATEE